MDLKSKQITCIDVEHFNLKQPKNVYPGFMKMNQPLLEKQESETNKEYLSNSEHSDSRIELAVNRYGG